MSDTQTSRPEHCPEGHEWLPDAYSRDIAPHGQEARELVRIALAEGRVKALLRDEYGQRIPAAERMWDKEPLDQKVYPWFENGRMRMRLQPYVGPYIVAWIFVPDGSLKAIVEAQYDDDLPSRVEVPQDDGHPAKPDLTRDEPRKRGRPPWPTTLAIRKMIPIIEARIGGSATPTAMRAYFRKERITKSTPGTFHKDFTEVYIERGTLHWKDGNNNPHKMEITSLGAHRRALAKT